MRNVLASAGRTEAPSSRLWFTLRESVVSRRCPRGSEAEERHRRKAPENAPPPPDGAVEGKERSDAVRATRSAATSGEGDPETERSASLRGSRRGVGCADRQASFQVAKRTGNAARRHLPLCPFSLPRRSGAPATDRGHDCCCDRGKRMDQPHLDQHQIRRIKPGGGNQVASVCPGKSGFGLIHGSGRRDAGDQPMEPSDARG